jgi:hypothetical protein
MRIRARRGGCGAAPSNAACKRMRSGSGAALRARVPPLKPREFSKIVHPASGWCVLKQLEAVTDLT